MSVPLEALESVVFRASRLGDFRSSVVSWNAEVVSRSEDQALISLEASTPRLVNNFPVVGFIDKPHAGGITLPGLPAHPVLSSLDTRCALCGTKRARKSVVFLEDDEPVVAGVECLARAGYLPDGIPAQQFFDALVRDPRSVLEQTAARIAASPHFDILHVLAAAISVYRRVGYLSKSRAHSSGRLANADYIAELLQPSFVGSPVGVEIQENLLSAAVLRNEVLGGSLGQGENASDFHRKIRDAVALPAVPAASIGLIAAVPHVFRALAQPAAAPTPWANAWVGEVGERVTVQCRLESSSSVAGLDDPNRKVLTFRDSENHCIVWMTSAAPDIQVGSSLALKGTVKSHTEYRGRCQTLLSRCRVGADAN